MCKISLAPMIKVSLYKYIQLIDMKVLLLALIDLTKPLKLIVIQALPFQIDKNISYGKLRLTNIRKNFVM